MIFIVELKLLQRVIKTMNFHYDGERGMKKIKFHYEPDGGKFLELIPL